MKDNEATAYPWWLIIDPKQMMKPEARIVGMSMITGPFVNRERAERYLKARSYAFSDRAVVWCASGHESEHWRKLVDNHLPVLQDIADGGDGLPDEAEPMTDEDPSRRGSPEMPCEGCGQSDQGSKLRHGWFRCTVCGYPGQ